MSRRLVLGKIGNNRVSVWVEPPVKFPSVYQIRGQHYARSSEMSPIKDLSLAYEAPNTDGTFSEGHTIVGTVSFRLTKEVKVKRIFIKAKGDANVHWTEGFGDSEESYSAHRRFFKAKEYLIEENAKGTVLPAGVHSYQFELKIPEAEMPSSFKGSHGRIVYMVEAKISRSWRMPSTVQKEISFMSKSIPHIGQVMQCPQTGSVSKDMSSKGKVQMSATVNRKVCCPGETLSAFAKISNFSSKTMKPKFSLEQRIVYRASGSTKTTSTVLFKMVGDTISASSEETASCQMKIPDDAIYTLLNCDIISVEYYIKVYLDISFAFDPEVVFPLVIVPSSFATIQPEESVGPFPPEKAGAPSYSDFSSSAFPTGFGPVPTGPGACQYPPPDPTQHANPASGYYDQWPQHGSTYGFPNAPSSSVQQPGPIAPSQFPQEGQPPTYMSLYPHLPPS